MAAWIRRLLARVRGLFAGGSSDEERAREIAAHLALLEEEFRAKGMTPEESRRHARLRLGNEVVIREEVREMSGVPFVENLWRDVGYALRQMRKSPGFAVTAVLTLALGVGAASAMFSVLDAVVLHPLPYRNVDRMTRVLTKLSADKGCCQPESWPEYEAMRQRNTTFRAVVGMSSYSGMTLRYGGRTAYLHTVQGTDNFFALFGVQPLLGRTYLPGEDQPGKNRVAVLSYSVWQEYFGGRKDVLGETVNLDGDPFTVIGVMPAGFRVRFDASNVIYVPLQIAPAMFTTANSHWLPVWGLLKAGVTPAQATADMNHVFSELARKYPEDKGKTARVVSYTDMLHMNQEGRDNRTELWVLLGAVFSVLLIACANVAGLLLARGIQREREMAVRAALGAGRKRLVRQMLTESVVLGLAGGVCGLALSYVLLAGMRQFLEKAFARGGDVHLNLTVTVVTFGVALIASVAAGLAPAWRAARMDANKALKTSGSAGTSRGQHRLRSGFVVAQVALSLVLLVCSGLLLLGLRSMLARDLGFNPKNLLTLEVDIPEGDYKGRDVIQTLVQPLEARAREIPGVTDVGSNIMLPILQYGTNSDLPIVGKPVDPPDRERWTEIRFVTPGYFATMQMPILKGRNFTAQDTAKSQPVAIVNEAWVKEFLNEEENPLSQAFAGDSGSPNTAIVGLTRSGRQDIMLPPLAEADFPMTQMPSEWKQAIPQFYLFIRTAVLPTSITSQLRTALHDVGPDIAFRTPETMEDVVNDALVTNRMLSWLFGLFAGIAVVLTAIGVYGLLSQEVASRTRDIGVRMALGATRGEVARLVLAQVGILLGLGLMIGVGGTLMLRRVFNSMLPLRLEHEAGVITALAVLLAAIGVVAAMIPAQRAASVDPMEALRAE